MNNNILSRGYLKWFLTGIFISGLVYPWLKSQEIFSQTTLKTSYNPADEIIIKLSDTKNSSLLNVNGSILLDDENILIRTSQTIFLAVNLICGHKDGCTVELTSGQFVCSCCGSEYDITGKVTHGPSTKNLKTWETNYDPDKGTVTVKMDKKVKNK